MILYLNIIDFLAHYVSDRLGVGMKRYAVPWWPVDCSYFISVFQQNSNNLFMQNAGQQQPCGTSDNDTCSQSIQNGDQQAMYQYAITPYNGISVAISVMNSITDQNNDMHSRQANYTA